MRKIRILIDGDACPGISIIEKVAEEKEIEVIIFCNISHRIEREYSKVIYVDKGFQSVDIRISNEIEVEDIIVSQDYGVATIAIAKKAYAISPRGYIYSDKNIDRLLEERHLNRKARSAGSRTKNQKKRDNKDDEKLYYNLKKLIERRE